MILTSPNDIAEGFNTFFSNIGPNLAEKIGSTECHFKDYTLTKLILNLLHSNQFL
jgi:hypothetical protein